MEVVDVDPLAVLPVTASASDAFARAADFSRDRDERQEQLRSLTTTLASGEPTTVVLRDAIGQSCVICPLVSPLVPGGPCGG
jgi:C4-type Zn-finger protein